MIKNIFFDLDNTIIRDEDIDAEDYKIALKELGYDENDFWKVYEAIDLYEAGLTEENPYYNEEECLAFINKTLNKNYSMELMDRLVEIVGECWTKRVMLPENIIKKLSEKYDLYVFTNFFAESQFLRIKTIGYDKYFKKLFGADEYGLKSFKKSYQKVLEEINAKPEECLIVGDSIVGDVAIPKQVGMQAILFDYDGKRNKTELVKDYNIGEYKVITDFNQLVELIEK